MRRAALSIVLIILAFAARASDVSVDTLLKDARAAEERFDVKSALELYTAADAARPNDAFILQKIARQYSDLDATVSDAAGKRRLYTQAVEFSQRAVELQPTNPVNVLSLAISYGKLGSVSGTRTEVEYSRLVKQLAERALELDPNYDYACHVLGIWHREVASLGAGTRFFAKLIYGGLPPASVSEAVRLLRRAVELSPDLPSHRVELGFALLAADRPGEARRTFEAALAMPRREAHDEESWARARAALAKIL